MEVLPFSCPKKAHDFKKSTPFDDRRPYFCARGQVILSATVLYYLEPLLDQDGRRAKLVLDLITEAWDGNNLAPYINAPLFDRRLAEVTRPRGFWGRLFR